MRAGDLFMRGLEAHGTTHIFGNPGTTENGVLDRLADHPGLDYVTVLHEGVAVAAAAYHALATGRTGIVNVHITPGLGNAIGLMFGALKAEAPVIITAGQQDTRLQHRRPLFHHDMVAMARPVTKWAGEPQSGADVGPMLEKAFAIANTPPFGPVFLSLPVNVLEEEVEDTPMGVARRAVSLASAEAIADCAKLLSNAKAPAIVAGDGAAMPGGPEALRALVEKSGAALFREPLHVHSVFPSSHSNFRGRLPLDAGNIAKVLAPFDTVILIGGQFFEEMWVNPVSPVPDTATIIRLENNAERLRSYFRVDCPMLGDIAPTLSAIAAELDRAIDTQAVSERNAALADGSKTLRQSVADQLNALPDTAPMSPMRAMHEITQGLPKNAVVIEEALTAGLVNVGSGGDAIVGGAMYSSLELGFSFEKPGDLFGGRGGGLGQGMAGALGLQIANPDRRVAALIGDGSGMYAIQSLWTAAHRKLPILFFIFSNREYRVLKHNLDIHRMRFGLDMQKPYPHMDLSDPPLDYSALAQGLGVQARHVTTPDELRTAIEQALTLEAPCLIDIEITGKDQP